MSWVRSKSPENLPPLPPPQLRAISEGRIKQRVWLMELEVALCFGLGKCDSVWVPATSVVFVS